MKRAFSIFFVVLVPSVAIAWLGAACGSSTSDGTGGDGSGTTSTHVAGTGSNATTGTMATTTTTTTTGTGGLSCPDGSYSNVVGPDCDLFLQNCPMMQKCLPYGDDTAPHGSIPGCSQGMSGLKTVAQPCTTDTECAEGLICIDVCTPICCPSNMQPCNGGACNIKVTLQDSAGQPTDGFFFICSFAPQCTLFDPAACDPGLDCHPDGDQPGLATCIAPTGDDIPEGGICDALNDCGTMQTCVTVGNNPDALCYWLCDLGSSAAPGLGGCPATETCTAFDLGFPNVGLCIPN